MLKKLPIEKNVETKKVLKKIASAPVFRTLAEKALKAFILRGKGFFEISCCKNQNKK